MKRWKHLSACLCASLFWYATCNYFQSFIPRYSANSEYKNPLLALCGAACSVIVVFLIYFCVRGLPANLFPCDVYLCLVMLTNHVCSKGSSEYMLAVAVLSMYPGFLGLYSSGLRSEVKLILGNSHINSQTAGCSSEWNDINQKGNGSVSWF